MPSILLNSTFGINFAILSISLASFKKVQPVWKHSCTNLLISAQCILVGVLTRRVAFWNFSKVRLALFPHTNNFLGGKQSFIGKDWECLSNIWTVGEVLNNQFLLFRNQFLPCRFRLRTSWMFGEPFVFFVTFFVYCHGKKLLCSIHLSEVTTKWTQSTRWTWIRNILLLYLDFFDFGYHWVLQFDLFFGRSAPGSFGGYYLFNKFPSLSSSYAAVFL